MSSHLSFDQTSRLAAALRERQQALRRRMQVQLEGQSRVEHAHELLLQDGDDDTQRDADREVDLATTDREATGYASLERAVARMVAGTYGECLDCGEPIPFERLELEPQALRCVACATQRERRAPRTASM